MYLPKVMHSSGYHPVEHWHQPRGAPPKPLLHAMAHRFPGSPFVPALPHDAKPEAQNRSLNQVFTSPAPSCGARPSRGMAVADASHARAAAAKTEVKRNFMVGDGESEREVFGWRSGRVEWLTLNLERKHRVFYVSRSMPLDVRSAVQSRCGRVECKLMLSASWCLFFESLLLRRNFGVG